MAAAPRIAILGWGSLIPHPRRLQIRGPFVQGGPLLPVEFSRRSDRGRLTLVIDRRGDEVPTYFALAAYPTLEAAVEGLRQREGSRVRTEEIGVATATAVFRSRDPEVGERIRAWTQTRNLDATIWTDLDSEWPEFTLDLAVDHLRTLADADVEHARRYFVEAPPETNTPLRRHLASWIRGGALPS